MVRRFRAAGVRTVVWITPWVNLDSSEGQTPPDPASRALHRAPASNYAEGAERGHYVRDARGEPYVARWWMGTGSPIDFTSPAAEAWWREQAKGALELGVEGIKADDGEGYYFPDDVCFADGSTGAQAAWRARRRCTAAACSARSTRSTRARRAVRAQRLDRPAGDGNAVGRRPGVGLLVAARARAATASAPPRRGFSNWSHDIGGYLGHRLVERCPPELLVRWVQLGCFTPLMQAHGRMVQEPWTYDERTLDIYRSYVLLHERLVPYIRAAAATAQRSGLPIIRPLHLADPSDERGWTLADAYGFGPALWVAPVLDEGAREREVVLPHGDWIETWSGAHVRGGREVVVPAPRSTIPVWVRRGSIVVTYPAAHVAAGLGDTPERAAPARGDPLGRARARTGRRPAGRRHEDRLAARHVVGRPPARRRVSRALSAAAPSRAGCPRRRHSPDRCDCVLAVSPR